MFCVTVWLALYSTAGAAKCVDMQPVQRQALRCSCAPVRCFTVRVGCAVPAWCSQQRPVCLSFKDTHSQSPSCCVLPPAAACCAQVYVPPPAPGAGAAAIVIDLTGPEGLQPQQQPQQLPAGYNLPNSRPAGLQTRDCASQQQGRGPSPAAAGVKRAWGGKEVPAAAKRYKVRPAQ
jgi:hypothetical protein